MVSNNRWLAALLQEGGVLETLYSALVEQCLFETMFASCSCTYCSQAGVLTSFVVVIVVLCMNVIVIVMERRH